VLTAPEAAKKDEVASAPPATSLSIALLRLRFVLVEPWPQRAVLIAAIVWVFWDGIFAGVPRSDQIHYLHHVSQYDSLWDILSHSPSWNRTTPDPYPDLILYRPVLYLLLGTLYYLFRYDFIAWQIAGLTLHILVALGLHLLLIQGGLKRTLFPLLIALLFATAFFASELVLWNHLVGYLLFCALEVYAVYLFLRFLQSDRAAFLVGCAALSLIAEFTYEAGAIVNLLFAATLLGRGFASPAGHTSPGPSRPRSARWPAVLFVLLALLLPIASLIDLRARGFQLAAGGGDAIQTLKFMLQVAENSVLQIAFWFSTWLAPSLYHCTPLHRAICGVSKTGLTPLRLINLVALAWLAIGAILAFSRLRRSGAKKREPLAALALCAAFLLGYSMIIAIGRTAPKGLMFILQANIYYTYMAFLAVCVGIAVASFAGRSRVAPVDGGSGSDAVGPAGGSAQPARGSDVGRRLIPTLAALVLVNACSTHEFAHAYRYEFAEPRQEVIDRVLAWEKRIGYRSQRYFTIGQSCKGNDTIWWLDEKRVRKDSGWRPPITLADALWPERSADLNGARIYIQRQSVDEIQCGEHGAGQ
jgi:hypothetical protein